MTVPLVIHKGFGGGPSWWEVVGKDCTISIERRPSYCDRGNWIAKLHPVSGSELAREIDGQDCWPRYFFDFARMLLELEAWLEKRGQMPDPPPSSILPVQSPA